MADKNIQSRNQVHVSRGFLSGGHAFYAETEEILSNQSNAHLRIYACCARFFCFAKTIERQTVGREEYQMKKNAVALEIEALKDHPMMLLMRQRLLEEVVTPLKTVFENYNMETIEAQELLLKHLNESLGFISVDAVVGEHGLGPLYYPLLEVFFPEILAKTQMFCSHLWLSLSESRSIDSQTIYNQAASTMEKALEFVKGTPVQFQDREDLINILTHNCEELTNVRKHFAPS